MSKPLRAEPFVAWPGIDNLKLSLPISASFLKFFYSVYGTTSLLAATRHARQGLHFGFELDFPFVPSLALLSLTVPLLLAATPFILRTWRELAPFFVTLAVETAIGGLCFFALPVAQGYPPRQASGFWGGLFWLTDSINLDYNEVPSLQAAFAITAAIVLSRRCRGWGKALFAGWAGAVMAASLLLHEHHLLDVATGALLGVATVATIHPWASKERRLDALAVELTWLGELLRSSLRHPRRAAAVLKQLPVRPATWGRTRPLRAVACLAGYIDAVLAGERKVAGEPQIHVARLLAGLRGEAALPETSIGRLASFVAAELAELGAREVHTRDDLERLPTTREHPASETAAQLPWRVEP